MFFLIVRYQCNLVPRALFPGLPKAREKRPGDEVDTSEVWVVPVLYADKQAKKMYIYSVPLTNLVFSVRTVSYGPSFFPLIYGAKREARGT